MKIYTKEAENDPRLEQVKFFTNNPNKKNLLLKVWLYKKFCCYGARVPDVYIYHLKTIDVLNIFIPLAGRKWDTFYLGSVDTMPIFP